MHYYIIYGLVVQSDIRFDEALEIDKASKIDIVIHRTIILKGKVKTVPSGSNSIYIYQMEWSCINYRDQGIFCCIGGSKIEYELSDLCDQKFIRQIILSWCFGILFVQRRELAIHGSAVVFNKKLIIISGESGAGKSSFTTECLKRGAMYISDDIVRIQEDAEGRQKAFPAYPQRKLCPDTIDTYHIDKGDLVSMNDIDRRKYALRSTLQYYDKPIEPDVLVVIQKKNVQHAEINEVKGADKVKLIVDNLFKQDAYKSCGLEKSVFCGCMKLAQRIAVYQICRPEKKMTISEQVDLVEKRISCE